MKAHTYTCAVCKGTFESERPDEEAQAELRDHWGDIPIEACDLVCDDCWKAMGLDAPGLEDSRVVMRGEL